MAYTIEQIEDAIISALAPLKADYETEEGDPAIYATVRTVKTYQGELEEDDIKRMTALFPAIYIVYGGSEYKKHGARKVEEMSYYLFVCDKNLRSEEEARRGGTENPGTYAMLNGIRDLLLGKRLSMSIFPFGLVREIAVWFGSGISVYAAHYTTAQALLYASE